MDYDLIGVWVDGVCLLLLKHPLLFERVLEIYRCVGKVQTYEIGVYINMAEYIFMKDTLGRDLDAIDAEELRDKCELILKFIRTFKDKPSGEFKLCDNPRMIEHCVHVIYSQAFEISIVSDCGLHISQFYGDFQYIEQIGSEMAEMAREFFQGKKWKNKDLLCKKVQAFKILFSN